MIVLAGTAATAVLGQQLQRITLKDGNTIDGIVTKTDAGYQVKRPNGLVAVIPADRVLKVEKITTPKSEFEKRLAKVKPNDADGMYQLAAWARQKKMLPEAWDLVEKILAFKPDHENAQLLRKLLEKDLAPATPVTPTTTTGATIEPSKLLTTEDVYRIRRVELRRSDDLADGEVVSVRFRKDLLKRVVKDRLGPQFERPRGVAEFRRWRPIVKVRYILRERETTRWDTKYRDDILIMDDPQRLRTFKNQIWPIVVGGCGSTNCHGGAKGKGKLKLFAAPLRDDRIAYTNFYILHRWSRGGKKLINRAAPVKSRLLECGLPDEMADQALKHPKPLADPVFQDRDRDANYRVVKKWIESLKHPFLEPGYRIDYKLPVLEDKKK